MDEVMEKAAEWGLGGCPECGSFRRVEVDGGVLCGACGEVEEPEEAE